MLGPKAQQNFDDARRRALRAELAARLTGRDTHLLPFEAIRTHLRHQSPLYRGIQYVPLDKIVGSVGRYHEFNREFMPRSESLRDRWVRVDLLARERGWPPVELYRIGDAYFVRDGNHRTSVARQMALDTIEAHVWEFPIEVPIGPEDSLDDILIRLGEEQFMAETGLDNLIPDHNIHFTVPGRYTELQAQIHDLWETLAVIDGERLPFDEAVRAWYEMVYLPTVQIIYETRLLEDFPGRTEADLFAWLSRYRDVLSDHYGDYENLGDLALMLAERYRERGMGKVTRQFRRLLGRTPPAPLETPEAPDPDDL